MHLPSRNSQIFGPLDFVTEVTQHPPSPWRAAVGRHPRSRGEHLIRYYGWPACRSLGGGRYSNKTRGQRAPRQPSAGAGTGIPARSPTAREAREGWAALIKQVYASDPICCPKCGAEMRIIALIEQHQTDVIEKILRHCGLWDENPSRGPPVPEVSVED